MFNKRDKISPNHSPGFKSSNRKPSSEELFGILRPPFEHSSTMQSSIPNFIHLSPVGLNKKGFFFVFSYVFLFFKHRSPWCKAILGPSDLGLEKLNIGHLGNATYLISSI